MDVSIFGEPKTAPHIRIPSLPVTIFKMILSAIFSWFGDESALPVNVIFFLFDGRAHGNLAALKNMFTNSDGKAFPDRSTKTLYVNVDEDAIINRKGCVRRVPDIDQVEYLLMVCKGDAIENMKVVKGKHFKGSTRGNKIGDVELPDLSKAWRMTEADKKLLHGPHRVAVGGPTDDPDTENLTKGAKRKLASELEPVFWHGRHVDLYDEILHRYPVKRIIDANAADGTLAHLAAKLRRP